MNPNSAPRTFTRLINKTLLKHVQEQKNTENREAEADGYVPIDYVPVSTEHQSPELDKDDANSHSNSSMSKSDSAGVFIGLQRMEEFDDNFDTCIDSSATSSSETSILRQSSTDDNIEDFENLDVNASSLGENDTNWKAEMEESLNNKVAKLAIKHRLKHTAINDVLGLLRELGHDVHKDARTVLGTTKDTSDDNFEHFGLIEGLARKIRNGVAPGIHRLELQINIDGIPLYRSSTTNFWPILGRLSNGYDCRPFVISVYCGPSKPPDLKSFLGPFIEEMKKLENRSLKVDGRSFHVYLKSVVCDAPARSFVKQTISVNGKFGCDRCEQIGIKIGGCMTFPDFNATTRNNYSFRRKNNKDHHRGDSPFEELGIDMNHSFPVDYMHLICLGVVKKLLMLWRGEKNLKRHSAGKRRKSKINNKKTKDREYQLTEAVQTEINKRIDAASKLLPREFQRKGRSLNDLEHWKAVEYRTFLLYTGPIVLKDIIEEKNYNHFLILHAAIRILCSPSLTAEQITYADACLRCFVRQFDVIYGSYQLVYCVHSLIHLANECAVQRGPLDSFSAFPFESYLGQLKALLRGTRRPLSQLKKRLSEMDKHDTFVISQSRVGAQQFSVGSLKLKSPNDCFVMKSNIQILEIKIISETSLSGERYLFIFMVKNQ